MKYIFVIMMLLGLVSCREKPKTKTEDNLKAAEDTSKKVDTKKKAVLNHRY